eukprot:363340-Chlamydomonas_euryale.AAC.8
MLARTPCIAPLPVRTFARTQPTHSATLRSGPQVWTRSHSPTHGRARTPLPPKTCSVNSFADPHVPPHTCLSIPLLLAQSTGAQPDRPIRYPAHIPPSVDELLAKTNKELEDLREGLRTHVSAAVKELRTQVGRKVEPGRCVRQKGG